MRVSRLLVSPYFDDREMVRSHTVLEDVEAQAPGFLAARRCQISQQTWRVWLLTADINVGDDVDGLSLVSGGGGNGERCVRALIVAA